MAKDFSSDQPTPQGRNSTSFDAHESGTPVQCCDNCEPQKLGSESIANFGAGPGVSGGGTKIR